MNDGLTEEYSGSCENAKDLAIFLCANVKGDHFGIFMDEERI